MSDQPPKGAMDPARAGHGCAIQRGRGIGEVRDRVDAYRHGVARRPLGRDVASECAGFEDLADRAVRHELMRDAGDDDRQAAWIATRGGRPMDMVRVWGGAACVEVVDVAVVPDARRGGVGTRWSTASLPGESSGESERARGRTEPGTGGGCSSSSGSGPFQWCLRSASTGPE